MTPVTVSVSEEIVTPCSTGYSGDQSATEAGKENFTNPLESVVYRRRMPASRRAMLTS